MIITDKITDAFERVRIVVNQKLKALEGAQKNFCKITSTRIKL